MNIDVKYLESGPNAFVYKLLLDGEEKICICPRINNEWNEEYAFYVPEIAKEWEDELDSEHLYVIFFDLIQKNDEEITMNFERSQFLISPSIKTLDLYNQDSLLDVIESGYKHIYHKNEQ